MIDGRQQSSCTCLRDITPKKKYVKFDEASVFHRSIEKLTFFKLQITYKVPLKQKNNMKLSQDVFSTNDN